MDCVKQKINLDEPRYDQETYIGRAKHFFLTTNPLNLFVSNQRLEEVRCLMKYRILTLYPLISYVQHTNFKVSLDSRIEKTIYLTNDKKSSIQSMVSIYDGLRRSVQPIF